LELRVLKTFLEVARARSFHRAASALYYAQSTVSAQIQALEEETGVRLFDRFARHVALTPAGDKLAEYARAMLDLEAQALADLRAGEHRGALTVRVPESLARRHLPRVVARYRAACPGVRLSLTTCAKEGLEEDLRKGVTDLAFLLADSIRAKDLAEEFLGSEGLVLAVACGHRLAGKTEVSPRDLAGETLVLTQVECSTRQFLEDILVEEGVKSGESLECMSLAAVVELVAAGAGVTILPRAMAEEDARLAILPLNGSDMETGVLMIHHRDKWLSPPLVLFMDMVRDAFTEKADNP